jgi:hypothetical protein
VRLRLWQHGAAVAGAGAAVVVAAIAVAGVVAAADALRLQL